MSAKKNWPARTSIAWISGLALAQAVHAQTAPVPVATTPADAASDVVLVTGSRIARRDANTAGPMTTLTKDDIAFVAPTSVGDLLQAMPNVGVSLNSNGTQGTAFGVSSINLRYLGSAEGSGNRTLVLVDGHRWVNATGGRGFRDFVDLNTIPLGIIDRIEVLKDGASAIYGADAIAGVVNILTKRRLDGIEADLRVGTTSRKDNDNYSGFINWGKRFDKGSLFLSASFNDAKPILTADRDISRVALSPLTAPPTSPNGLYVLPGLSNNSFFGTPTGFASNTANAVARNAGVTTIGTGADADNSFHRATLPEDYYNTQAQGIYATGPSKRNGFFARGTLELNDNVTARIEGVFSSRRSSQMFSPASLDVRGSNGFTIARDQAFNPFGTANGVPSANALAFSGSTFRVQRLPLEVGNRDNVQNVDMSRVLLGLEGSAELYGQWQWDMTLTASRSKASFDALNQLNMENVFRGLSSPTVCSATPGCVPLNLFGTITPEMADYMRFNGHDENSAAQTDFTFNATRKLMQLQGGAMGLATGYEYRKESATDSPDLYVATTSAVLPLVGGARQFPTTAASRDPTSGSYDLHEVYAELNAPLLANQPGIYKLEVDAATRYSRYSTVGGKATSKLGLMYNPVKPLLLRASYSQGFRAPSILELYQGQRQTTFQAVDPCNGGGGSRVGCAGIPTTYNQNQFGSGTIAGITAGNSRLKAETADTFSLGLALTPETVPGLTITSDAFLIKVKDAIASQSATQILQSCATAGTFCDLVVRNASGEVKQLTQAVVNLSRIEVAGLDTTVRYVFPIAGGRLDTSMDLAYLQKFRSFVPQPDGSVVVDDRAGKSDQPRSTFPKLKGQGAVRYIASDYSLGWKARYIGSSDDVPNNAVNGGSISAVVYHDLQFNYTLPDKKVTLSFGMDNAFDQQPPASAANNPINFDMYTYDVRGRYFYGKVSARF
jgi:iron complex outermembrane receptor protein